ncbi:DUF4836 domain-containing protein [Brachyspira aalborgi]|uniref:DUF4836 domain-containing protein n=1 Tax=Brachyspira aalborgi TaxID=29522 RepID=UPI0011CB2F77|nr:DUF4836 domain-containing protein [Brachyspira aalborgi]TXJ14798.1 DUF4836 domain-containing protein [Brachyspira aalborgi]TXJ18567.1 DUF4836 domain-containing protein [Brachyspira aalborgi]TXJ48502.1 DUF4836 domain-containing protein [Brachyspira aalborgi]
MITTIKKKIVLTAILFITVFSISAYAVDKKYIPNTANAAISFSLDNLSKKAEGDLQQIFNSLFMQKFADNYLGYRDDEAVAETMTNKLAQLFDFSKASKIIFLNDYKQSSIIIDILDIAELDKLMIKMASQEDKLISFSENEKYRYLSLDENILISWNNEVFVLSLRGLIFEDDLNIKTSADIIFNSDSLENEYFISLENDTNDFYAWADLSILSDSESSLFELFGNMPEDIKDIYKGGILTAKVNFNDGIADMIFDTYLPNNDYDILSTKKELPEEQLLENLYKFVNGDKNYGFLSFRFNSSSTLVKSFISSFVNNEISSPSQLFEFCDGDIFVSAWDTEEENTAILFSMSITDEEKVKNALKTFSSEQEGEIYNIYGDYYYINNSILYMVTEESVINSIAKGETPNSTLDEDKLKLANDNMLSLYFNFNTNLGLLFGLEKYIGEFDSLSLTSNILDNNHIQTIVKVDAKDKTKNILIIIKTLIENIK